MKLELPNSANPLKIGTRGSPLALVQAHEVRRSLMAAFGLPDEAFEVAVISTTGDRVQDRPLKELGGKGLFTREIEDELASGLIDIAVHSMKDMPAKQPVGLVLDCFLPREDVRDALVSFSVTSLQSLHQGALVGTSSPRRKAQILLRRPDLRVVELRGNVQTRLRKLKEGAAQATFLAMAGLNRLALADVPSVAISVDDMLPAVAQGAIGIERRGDDIRAAELLAAVHHAPTGIMMAAERAFLTAIEGSCQTPIAGLAELDGGSLRLRAEILRTDGSEVLCGDQSGAREDAAEIGHVVAAELLARAGAGFFDWR